MPEPRILVHGRVWKEPGCEFSFPFSVFLEVLFGNSIWVRRAAPRHAAPCRYWIEMKIVELRASRSRFGMGG